MRLLFPILLVLLSTNEILSRKVIKKVKTVRKVRRIRKKMKTEIDNFASSANNMNCAEDISLQQSMCLAQKRLSKGLNEKERAVISSGMVSKRTTIKKSVKMIRKVLIKTTKTKTKRVRIRRAEKRKLVKAARLMAVTAKVVNFGRKTIWKDRQRMRRRIVRRRRVVVKRKKTTTNVKREVQKEKFLKVVKATRLVVNKPTPVERLVKRVYTNIMIKNNPHVASSRPSVGPMKLTRPTFTEVIKECIKIDGDKKIKIKIKIKDDPKKPENDNTKEDDNKDKENEPTKSLDAIITEMEALDAEYDFDKSENIYEDFQEWTEFIENFYELVEDFEEQIDTDSTSMEKKKEDIERRIRQKLIGIFKNPNEKARAVLAWLYSFGNLTDTDPTLRFIEKISEDSDEPESEKNVGGKDAEVGESEDDEVDDVDNDDDSKEEVFNSNTLILCENENLEGPACTYIDVTELCADSSGKKIVNVKDLNIKSFFAPPGMFLRLNRNGMPNLNNLRGPFMWSHKSLFSKVTEIEIYTWNEFRTLKPNLRMDDRDYYVLSAVVTEQGSSQRTSWTDNVYKRYVCIKNENKRYHGVLLKRDSMKLFVPDGVRILLQNIDCGARKKKEDWKDMDYYRIEGPKEIDLGSSKFRQYKRIVLLNAPKKMGPLPNQGDDEIEENKEDEAAPDSTDPKNGDKESEEEDEEEEDEGKDKDDMMWFCDVNVKCVYGTTLAELKNSATEEKLENPNNVTLPDGTFLPLTASKEVVKTEGKEEGVCTGSGTNLPPPRVIMGPTEIEMSKLESLKVPLDMELEDVDDDDEDDMNDEEEKDKDKEKDDAKAVNDQGRRKSFLARYDPSMHKTRASKVHKNAQHHRKKASEVIV